MTVDTREFKKLTLVVAGDVMVDRYVWGAVGRISPEAPVPVVSVDNTTRVLGGAGNVAANLAGLGVRVILVGLRGDDEEGRILEDLCRAGNITPVLITDSARPTTLKTRIMAGGQQLLRMDRESATLPEKDIQDQVAEALFRELAGADAVVLSDYAKGVLLGEGVCRRLITLARDHDRPVLVDPKGRQWGRYRGADCITPNLGELCAETGLAADVSDTCLVAATGRIMDEHDIGSVLLTRGSRGVLLVRSGRPPAFIPAAAREVYDVSGAGDTVIATLAASMAMGMDPVEAARTANLAAGVVVGKVGTRPITCPELETVLRATAMTGEDAPGCGNIGTSRDHAAALIRRWQREGEIVVFTNGCFDLLHPGHIDLLRRAARLGTRLVVGLNSDRSVEALKGPARPIVREKDRMALLHALDSVDMVVLFDEATPLELLASLRPDILVKGEDYALDEIVGRDQVASYGGRVERVPLLKGYSTTEIEQRIIRNHVGIEGDSSAGDCHNR